ncbi:hypothetical protein LINPERHAP2_LOCUS18596 [Linum perenne]
MVENSSLKESGGKSEMAHPFIFMMTPGSRTHPLRLPQSFQLLIRPFQAFTFFAMDPPRTPTAFPKYSRQTQLLESRKFLSQL